MRGAGASQIWVQSSALLLNSCVTLYKPVHLSAPLSSLVKEEKQHLHPRRLNMHVFVHKNVLQHRHSAPASHRAELYLHRELKLTEDSITCIAYYKSHDSYKNGGELWKLSLQEVKQDI